MKTNLNIVILTLTVLSLLLAAWTYYNLFQDDAGLSSYIALSLTLLVGLATYYYTITTQKEVIVYREKVIDKYAQDKAQEQATEAAITLDDFTQAINKTRNEKDLAQKALQTLCKQVEAGQGAFYVAVETEGKRQVRLQAGYALNLAEGTELSFDFGEGLVGQAASLGQSLYVDEVPDGYIKIISGLGSASPRYLFLAPVKHEQNTLGVIEVATFAPLSDTQRKYIEQCASLVAQKMNAA
jgi:methyl-accepting chemotaxis protein